ncbi:MAG: hypothetical protein VX675_02815 [Planctomycetota bacterium]|nr:hypothetical protein [Planctomycetota bacterium]
MKVVRSFTASEQEIEMLAAVAQYHGFSKSSTITNLLKKEFWRIFPGGTEAVQPQPGARIAGQESIEDGES